MIFIEISVCGGLNVILVVMLKNVIIKLSYNRGEIMTDQINMEEFNKVFEEAFEKEAEEININAQLSQKKFIGFSI